MELDGCGGVRSYGRRVGRLQWLRLIADITDAIESECSSWGHFLRLVDGTGRSKVGDRLARDKTQMVKNCKD